MTKDEAVKRLVTVAKSQVGYREGPNNWNKYADSSWITKLYGWNVQNQPWCCVFVNWCFMDTFGYDVGSRLTYGGTAACANSAALFRNHGALVDTPEVGDQVFFFSGGGINHTGIVVEVIGSSIKTVEGNYSDGVGIGTYIAGSSKIAGYGRPNWSLVQSAGLTTPQNPVSSENGQNLPLKRKTLKRGMSGGDVKALQQKLINAGYSVGPDGADGKYGNNTFRAVVAFQEDHGLNVSGEADPETLAAFDDHDAPNAPAAPSQNGDGLVLPDLQTGSAGDAVTLLQAAMSLRGIACGKKDGEFGPITQAAINLFKQSHGMAADGKVDAEVWERLLQIKK